MKNLKRIAIIGNGGSGKSTLSQKLHSILNMPIYHLDKYFWKPNWTRPDPDEYKVVHDDLCERSEWIIDGNNLRHLEYRFNRADVIIFLDIPRYVCFWRVFRRTLKYYGAMAPSSAANCREEFSWNFVRFLQWVWSFNKDYSPRIIQLLKSLPETKEYYIFKSSKEIEQYLNMMRRASQP
jgi:adenylate kinase family enzyme